MIRVAMVMIFCVFLLVLAFLSIDPTESIMEEQAAMESLKDGSFE
jgi:F0F1-type ATP synthase membrane subunit b/b'